MTLLDLISKYVKVTNLDDDLVLFETGVNGEKDDLFIINLHELSEMNAFEDNPYNKEINNSDDIDELMTSWEYSLEHEIIEAAWLSYNGYDLSFEIGEDEWENMWEEYHKYEVCIGDDYKTELEIDIDLT